MKKLSKTLVAAAISGLLAIPAAHAVDTATYSKLATGSVKFSGSGCKTFNANKLDATLYVSNAFGAGIEGGIEGGSNTGFFELNMFAFGENLDGDGILVASNKGRTLNMDTGLEGFFDLESAMSDYVLGFLPENDGCKDENGYNFDTVINKYETKLSKNGEKAKLSWDAEGTYEQVKSNGKEKDKKVKVRVKTGQMDKLLLN